MTLQLQVVQPVACLYEAGHQGEGNEHRQPHPRTAQAIDPCGQQADDEPQGTQDGGSEPRIVEELCQEGSHPGDTAAGVLHQGFPIQSCRQPKVQLLGSQEQLAFLCYQLKAGDDQKAADGSPIEKMFILH